MQAEGFLTGTLVKTKNSFLPIEQLQINDEVVCFDLVNSYTIRPILYITTEIIDSYIQININGTNLNLAPGQKVYLAEEKQWIEAQQLTTNQILLAYNMQQVSIDSIALINETVQVYKVTVTEYHTFCVSSVGIIAHNFFPLIALGIGFAFGTGAVECTLGITAGIGILGSIIGLAASKQIGKHNKNNITPTINSIDSCTPGGSPQGPKKRNTDKAANMYEVFENHPIGQTLKKSLEPTKHNAQGQKIWRATKNMVEYGIKEGDFLYLDNLHKNHIEVFKSYGEGLVRTVLNLDGTCNEAKLKIAEKAVRTIWTYIRI